MKAAGNVKETAEQLLLIPEFHIIRKSLFCCM
jgi:hypothetical protein